MKTNHLRVALGLLVGLFVGTNLSAGDLDLHLDETIRYCTGSSEKYGKIDLYFEGGLNLSSGDEASYTLKLRRRAEDEPMISKGVAWTDDNFKKSQTVLFFGDIDPLVHRTGLLMKRTFSFDDPAESPLYPSSPGSMQVAYVSCR